MPESKDPRNYCHPERGRMPESKDPCNYCHPERGRMPESKDPCNYCHPERGRMPESKDPRNYCHPERGRMPESKDPRVCGILSARLREFSHQGRIHVVSSLKPSARTCANNVCESKQSRSFAPLRMTIPNFYSVSSVVNFALSCGSAPESPRPGCG